ncbi:O-methyltransferase [Peribacillus frigoritolerans]|uniref:O-methyltransferase n=1 Tax=Peribacillus frigoritolerans TaxID=450367 RepID=UPI00105A9F3B|nr:O-methyltransferase [Peribacillus frigoritolerans]TDL77959.1 O-methyltransferase [Peribacillus frigoritolerans]
MTTPATWKKADDYFISKLHSSDPDMSYILKANEEAGLPEIDVAPNQGKQLYLLAKMKGAKRILEIGTLGGYSSIWLARALPEDGKLITLEYEERHAKVAMENMKKAGLDHKIEIVVGAALDTLPALQDQEPFDFIFIDADKVNYPGYFEWAMKLSKPGTVIMGDNVARGGKVIVENSGDENVKGIRTLMDLLSEEPEIEATAIQTVGSKGYDGFVLGIVK